MKLNNAITDLAQDDYRTCKFFLREALTYLSALGEGKSNSALNLKSQRITQCKNSIRAAKKHAAKVIGYKKLTSFEQKLDALIILLFCHSIENTVGVIPDYSIIARLWLQDFKSFTENVCSERNIQSKLHELCVLMIKAAIDEGFGFELLKYGDELPMTAAARKKLSATLVGKRIDFVIKFVEYGPKWSLTSSKSAIICLQDQNMLQLVNRYIPDNLLAKLKLGESSSTIGLQEVEAKIVSFCIVSDYVYFFTLDHTLYRFKLTECKLKPEKLHYIPCDSAVLVRNAPNLKSCFLIALHNHSITVYSIKNDELIECKQSEHQKNTSRGSIIAADAWTDSTSNVTSLLLLLLSTEESKKFWQMIHIDNDYQIIGFTPTTYVSKYKTMQMIPQSVAFTDAGQPIVVYIYRDTMFGYIEIALFDRNATEKIKSEAWKVRDLHRVYSLDIFGSTILISGEFKQQS